MHENHAGDMKARMRCDLLAAMKAKRTEEVSLLRSLVAEIDNAEAPKISPIAGSMERGPAEMARLVVTPAELDQVIVREMRSRESAADEFAALGEQERAKALRAQASLPEQFGIAAPKPPIMQPWGMRVAYIVDPVGVLWHVTQRSAAA